MIPDDSYRIKTMFVLKNFIFLDNYQLSPGQCCRQINHTTETDVRFGCILVLVSSGTCLQEVANIFPATTTDYFTSSYAEDQNPLHCNEYPGSYHAGSCKHLHNK